MNCFLLITVSLYKAFFMISDVMWKCWKRMPQSHNRYLTLARWVYYSNTPRSPSSIFLSARDKIFPYTAIIVPLAPLVDRRTISQKTFRGKTRLRYTTVATCNPTSRALSKDSAKPWTWHLHVTFLRKVAF